MAVSLVHGDIEQLKLHFPIGSMTYKTKVHFHPLAALNSTNIFGASTSFFATENIPSDSSRA